jgi:hypothetical protein
VQATSMKRFGAPQCFILFSAGHFAMQALHCLHGCECAQKLCGRISECSVSLLDF